MNYLIKLKDNTSENLGLFNIIIYKNNEKQMTHGFSNLDKAKGFVSGFSLALQSLGNKVVAEQFLFS